MKIRILSSFCVGLVLFLFLMAIPTHLWYSAETIPDEKAKVLPMGETPSADPSDVLMVCTPVISAPRLENTDSSDDSKSTEIVDSQDSKSPSSVSVPSSEELRDAYPDSKVLEHKNETSGNGNFSHSSAAVMTLPSKEEFFSEEFLNESPMVERKKMGVALQSVSQLGAFDIIPKNSGVNGRSIQGFREHFIEDGDSLEAIAQRYLGDETRADEIFQLNRSLLRTKDELPIGVVLKIPERY